ncbi:MAG: hypothetical protein ACTHN5_12200 [Phycisphaerae bacterium]
MTQPSDISSELAIRRAFEQDPQVVSAMHQVIYYFQDRTPAPLSIDSREQIISLLRQILFERVALRAYSEFLTAHSQATNTVSSLPDEEGQLITECVIENRFDRLSDRLLLALASDIAWLSVLQEMLPEVEGEGWREFAEAHGEKLFSRYPNEFPSPRDVIRSVAHKLKSSSPGLPAKILDLIHHDWAALKLIGLQLGDVFVDAFNRTRDNHGPQFSFARGNNPNAQVETLRAEITLSPALALAWSDQVTQSVNIEFRILKQSDGTYQADVLVSPPPKSLAIVLHIASSRGSQVLTIKLDPSVSSGTYALAPSENSVPDEDLDVLRHPEYLAFAFEK